MHLFQEELLEPIARHVRFTKGLAHIKKSQPVTIVDMGCGPKLRFYHFAQKNKLQIEKYIGVDPLIEKSLFDEFKNHQVINIVNKPVDKKISIKDNTADYVVAFAFFEHIDHPKEILAECYRILKPGGKIILTTPTFAAKSVLEFLSYKLGLISRREIEEHKQYFDEYTLRKIAPSKVRRSQISHQYFEMWMNNLLVIQKSA